MDNADLKALIAAIDAQDLESIARLVLNNPEQKCAHTFFAGATWLGYAAGRGKLISCKALVSAGADVNQGCKRENVAPICNAAGGGHSEVVDYLLRSGARLDVSASVTNPLMWAVTHWQQADDVSIVTMLLTAGIDSTVKYPYSGRTKLKKPLDATAKSFLWGTPAKAGVIAAWNAGDDEIRMRSLLEEAMAAADSHLDRYKYGTKKLLEMRTKRERSMQKAIAAAKATRF